MIQFRPTDLETKGRGERGQGAAKEPVDAAAEKEAALNCQRL